MHRQGVSAVGHLTPQRVDRRLTMGRDSILLKE
jgi:hypothetical protein